MAIVQDLLNKIIGLYSFLQYEMFEADDDRFLDLADGFLKRAGMCGTKKNKMRRMMITLLVEEYGDNIQILESDWVFHCAASDL